MSTNENLRVSLIQTDPKNIMRFSEPLTNGEVDISLDNELQTKMLAWLVNKRLPVYQGIQIEISYTGEQTPIEGNRTADVLKLIKRLRKAKPCRDVCTIVREFMLDLAAEAERLEYIFCTHEDDFIKNRFGWLFDLMNDIQTLVDGFAGFKNNKIGSSSPRSLGGGNLAIPILVCTGLELVSALRAGKTKYLYDKQYEPEENVNAFISIYFDGNLKRMPRLLWNGVRNGVDHLFIPKTMQCNQNRIRFNFRLDEGLRSDVDQFQGIFQISIASVKFYEAFNKAVEKYRKDLTEKEGLQRDFIKAWSSIEAHNQNISNNDAKL